MRGVLFKLVFVVVSFTFFWPSYLNAQRAMIKSMEWGSNLEIRLELTNDSTHILDVNQLPHSHKKYGRGANDYTYYPARLSEKFINQLKEIKIEHPDSIHHESEHYSSDKTLWSALHHLIGGGYPHFINTVLYALEQGYIDLSAPLMKRPDTQWKPQPITESYKRTRKWEYYVPVNQRYAHQEYKKRMQEGELKGIREIPDGFIRLFQNTGNREYKRLQNKGNKNKLAKIDLVKLILGAHYLGNPQIQYIQTMVLKAVNAYSKNYLPSVIIFDNFNAAVGMSLNETGYRVDKIVFSDADRISREIKMERKKDIVAIVKNINEMNKKLFRERLKEQYH
jgi:hypothetical protein